MLSMKSQDERWMFMLIFHDFFQVEVKPYVLDDQLCDECQGARCGGKFAPFFCANVTCLQVIYIFPWYYAKHNIILFVL